MGGHIIPIRRCNQEEDLENLVAAISKKEKYLNALICNGEISGPKAESESEKATDLTETLFKRKSFQDSQSQSSSRSSKQAANPTAISPPREALFPRCQALCQPQGHFSYNVAKGTTVYLSKHMSYEFKNAGIGVNRIASGCFPSEMTTKESDTDQKRELPDEKVEEKGHVPMSRAGSDEEIAQGVIFSVTNKCVNEEGIALGRGVCMYKFVPVFPISRVLGF